MQDIVIFEGDDLAQLLSYLRLVDTSEAYRVRVCVDGGFKIKVNESTWSPPLGRLADENGW